jgi:hypothetical protein
MKFGGIVYLNNEGDAMARQLPGYGRLCANSTLRNVLVPVSTKTDPSSAICFANTYQSAKDVLDAVRQRSCPLTIAEIRTQLNDVAEKLPQKQQPKITSRWKQFVALLGA